MRRPSIAIIGPGALGSALATALFERKYALVELVARDSTASFSRAKELARRLGTSASTLDDAHLQADVIFFCTPDDAIASTASLFANRIWNRKIALHASGALPASVLAPLKKAGATIASIHPMMSFVRSAPSSFEDVWFALEGDRSAVHAAAAIAKSIGGRSFKIRAAAKPLYHALGAFLSPLIIAELTSAEQIARRSGISKHDLPGIMRPIVLRTIDNYFAKGAAASFSGPMLRGDVDTIRRHVRALSKMPERELYTALVREAVRNLPVRRKKDVLAAL